MAVRRLRSRRCYCVGLDGNPYLPGESLRDAFADAHGNGNCHTNRDCYGHGHIYTYTYGYAETDAHAEICAYTKASPDAGASAVTLSNQK